jgi:FAD:protein FMN transferase
VSKDRRGWVVWLTEIWRLLGLRCVVLLLVAGCSDGDDYRRYGGSTMGTYYEVTARCPNQVAGLIETTLHAVNAEMSTYLEDSHLSRFNRAAADEWFPVPQSVVQVVTAAAELSRQSQGAFDVTVGPLVNLWGFGPEESAGIPSVESISAALAAIGHERLAARQEPPALRKSGTLYVDLSAIAKGHGVDRVVQALEGAGCQDMLVDVGGEVRGSGMSPAGRPWRIGVEVPDPGSRGGIQRIVALADAALATSGDYRNFVEAEGRRYSHTIDPRTGYPVEHDLASVTVLHESAMWADGYATVLSVLGPQAGMTFAETHGLAALFVVRRAEGFQERYTSGFATVLLDN